MRLLRRGGRSAVQLAHARGRRRVPRRLDQRVLLALVEARVVAPVQRDLVEVEDARLGLGGGGGQHVQAQQVLRRGRQVLGHPRRQHVKGLGGRGEVGAPRLERVRVHLAEPAHAGALEGVCQAVLVLLADDGRERAAALLRRRRGEDEHHLGGIALLPQREHGPAVAAKAHRQLGQGALLAVQPTRHLVGALDGDARVALARFELFRILHKERLVCAQLQLHRRQPLQRGRLLGVPRVKVDQLRAILLRLWIHIGHTGRTGGWAQEGSNGVVGIGTDKPRVLAVRPDDAEQWL